ncbi:MAG: 50S ribosomal protein L18 [Pirellulales bacterium]|nr:50S ribosomal protein L18 [Pirellulales bacterium]
MNHEREVGKQRQRRRFRVRKGIRGTGDRPRLCVSRSHKHIYVQLIDDEAGKTLAAASTMDKEIASSVKYGGNSQAAETVGKVIAERAKAAGIEQVAFDRGHCQYHGRVASLAEAARKSGLKF